jgi:hypothetical protein
MAQFDHFKFVPSKSHESALLELLDLQTRRKRLLQLFGLLLVRDDEGIKKPRASNLELGALRILLYFDAFGILSSSLKEEILFQNTSFRTQLTK